MSVEIDGTKLTGIMDYLSGARRISDYKYTTAYATKDGLKPEWIAQQNCYRWMLHETTGILARELTIVAIYRDWHWRRAQKDMTYPQNPVEVLELPVWELEETAEWIQHRIAGIQYARATGDLRDCTDEERWQEKGAYALMKKKRKSAIKLFNSEPELRDYAENHKSERLLNPAKDLYIQRRYPVSKKCEHYCPALNFCDQGQKTMMERDPENYPL